MRTLITKYTAPVYLSVYHLNYLSLGDWCHLYIEGYHVHIER